MATTLMLSLAYLHSEHTQTAHEERPRLYALILQYHLALLHFIVQQQVVQNTN